MKLGFGNFEKNRCRGKRPSQYRGLINNHLPNKLQSHHIQNQNISAGPHRIGLVWDHVGWAPIISVSFSFDKMCCECLFFFVLCGERDIQFLVSVCFLFDKICCENKFL